MFARLKFNMRLFCGFLFLTLFVAALISVKLLHADAVQNTTEYLSRNNNEIAVLHEKINQLSTQISKLQKPYGKVKKLSYGEKKRILVTGGAGFVGSHLVDRLMMDGHDVTVVDNFFTGSKRNIDQWIGHPNFELIRHDIVNSLYVEVDEIYHLASPASPPHYMLNPVKTIKTNTIGTINLLGLARRVGARILVASTSEVYGDPIVHPQSEDYWGHVNPIGPRSCYDEGKRVAESLSYAYAKQEKVDVRVARIFNTYGPRMLLNDGRVVSNFILQALQNHSITIYGSGKQTRSFQYVSDLINGLVLLMNSNYSNPINLGNPEEYSIEQLATVIKESVGGDSPIVKQTGVQDDPQRRKPDIKRAKLYLGWSPKVRKYLKENRITVLLWPRNETYRIIVLLWPGYETYRKLLVRTGRKIVEKKPHSKRQLKEMLIYVWYHHLSDAYIQNLIQSVLERCAAINNAKGSLTKY